MSEKHFKILTPLSDAALASGPDVFAHYKTNSDLKNQMLFAIEECGELVQAITKMQRVYGNSEHSAAARDNLAEEIADVRIMVNQLTFMLDADAEVAKKVEDKLGRQRQRIAGTISAVSGY